MPQAAARCAPLGSAAPAAALCIGGACASRTSRTAECASPDWRTWIAYSQLNARSLPRRTSSYQLRTSHMLPAPPPPPFFCVVQQAGADHQVHSGPGAGLRSLARRADGSARAVPRRRGGAGGEGPAGAAGAAAAQGCGTRSLNGWRSAGVAGRGGRPLPALAPDCSIIAGIGLGCAARGPRPPQRT